MELVIFYLLLALSVSFLCSVLEAVLLSTPVSFITMKEQEGAKNAPLMKRLKQDIDSNNKTYQSSVYFMDIISELERMGDFMINISQSLQRAYGVAK